MTIRPSQVTITNLVFFRGEVIELDIDHIKIIFSDLNREYLDYKGIPINKEWLLALGCSYNGKYDNYLLPFDGYFHSVAYLNNPDVCEDTFAWSYFIDEFPGRINFLRTLKYVHELQNIHYWLCNIQLKNYEI